MVELELRSECRTRVVVRGVGEWMMEFEGKVWSESPERGTTTEGNEQNYGTS